MILSQIQQDTTAAMKAHDQKTVDVLRFVLSETKNKEIELQKPLSDEEVVGVIRQQVKKLRDAAEMFTKGGRTELAAQNEEQIAILSGYLPKEIGDDELRAAIETIRTENAAAISQNPKAIIGLAMGKLKDKADPSRIMKILNE